VKSLPQIRNLLETSSVILKLSSGEKNEVDDEGEETHCGGDGRTLPQGGKEREGGNSDEFVELTGFARSYAALGYCQLNPKNKHQPQLRLEQTTLGHRLITMAS
jgi:hypothetical protein